MRIAGCELRPRVADPNHRLTLEEILRPPLVLEPAAMDEAVVILAALRSFLRAVMTGAVPLGAARPRTHRRRSRRRSGLPLSVERRKRTPTRWDVRSHESRRVARPGDARARGCSVEDSQLQVKTLRLEPPVRGDPPAHAVVIRTGTANTRIEHGLHSHAREARLDRIDAGYAPIQKAADAPERKVFTNASAITLLPTPPGSARRMRWPKPTFPLKLTEDTRWRAEARSTRRNLSSCRMTLQAAPKLSRTTDIHSPTPRGNASSLKSK